MSLMIVLGHRQVVWFLPDHGESAQLPALNEQNVNLLDHAAPLARQNFLPEAPYSSVLISTT